MAKHSQMKTCEHTLRMKVDYENYMTFAKEHPTAAEICQQYQQTLSDQANMPGNVQSPRSFPIQHDRLMYTDQEM